MTERPIIFSGPMVRAILAGRKTQTRRVVTSHTSECTVPLGQLGLSRAWVDRGFPDEDGEYPDGYLHAPVADDPDGCVFRVRPRWASGDRLWVRETWAVEDYLGDKAPSRLPGWDPTVVYRADAPGCPNIGRWRPSIHMPRWASRLTLEVTAVRVERVQEIGAEDCIAEGCSTRLREHDACVALRDDFAALWDSINATRGHGWESNPWVWVVTFRRIEADHG